MSKGVKEIVNGVYGTIDSQLERIDSSADLTPRQYSESVSIMVSVPTKKFGDVSCELLVRKKYEKEPILTKPLNHMTFTVSDFNQNRNMIMRPITLAPAKEGAKYVIVYDSNAHAFGDVFGKYTLAKSFALIEFGYLDPQVCQDLWDAPQNTVIQRTSTDINIDRYACRELGMTKSQVTSVIDLQYTVDLLKAQAPNIDKDQIANIKSQRIDMILNIV